MEKIFKTFDIKFIFAYSLNLNNLIFGKKSKLLHNNLRKGCQLEFTLNALYIGETKNKNKVWTGAIEHHY